MERVFFKFSSATKHFKFWVNASEATFNKFLLGYEETKVNL